MPASTGWKVTSVCAVSVMRSFREVQVSSSAGLGGWYGQAGISSWTIQPRTAAWIEPFDSAARSSLTDRTVRPCAGARLPFVPGPYVGRRARLPMRIATNAIATRPPAATDRGLRHSPPSQPHLRPTRGAASAAAIVVRVRSAGTGPAAKERYAAASRSSSQPASFGRPDRSFIAVPPAEPCPTPNEP